MGAKRVAIALRDAPPINRTLAAAVRTMGRIGLRSSALELHVPRYGQIRVALPGGSSIVIDSSDGAMSRLYYEGWTGYERDTIPWFHALASRSSIVVDVGAHVGYFALVAAAANPSATVHAFEPMPEAAERLRHNVAINGVTNVTLHQAAVGAERGTARLYAGPTHAPSGSTLVAGWGETIDGHREFDIDVVALDDLDLGAVDLVKIDVELSEGPIFEGARRLLAEHRPDIVCEILTRSTHAPAIEAILAPLGYRWLTMTIDGLEPRSRIEADARSMNQLFTTRSDADLRSDGLVIL